MRSAVFLASLGFASGSEAGKLKLSWKDCGDSSTHGHITSVAPDELTLGSKTSIAGKGSLDEAMQAVSYSVDAKVGFIKLFSHTGDACKPDTIKLPAGVGEITMKGFKCPISAGDAELDLDVSLSSSIPAKLARLTIDLSAKSSTGDKALCVQIQTAPEGKDFFSMWQKFKADYNKDFSGNSDNEQKRFEIFKKNVLAAEEQNEIEPLATFGVDQFSDLTEEEFEQYMGYIPSDTNSSQIPEASFTAVSVPQSKDWTGTATTAVKNQGHCGSCWAFSATEQIESDYMLQKKVQVHLAPQELVDCKADRSERFGCKGGSTEGAYKVVEALGGMEPEHAYPYTHLNQRCSFQKSKARVQIASFQQVGKGNEAVMKSYVGSTGPLSVCGSAKSWKGYKGGILSNCVSGGGHCFQIVGYGVQGGVNYWKVRNSWGSHWGEEGHIRIKMNKNMCNIANNPTKVVIKSADESIVV